jgi:hypothetical protein
MYKKQLFVMKGDEKPEQNIELGADNRTFIINFVSDYHQDSFNLSVAFNNSNDLVLIKNNIIVKINVQQFLEPEELVIPIQYKPGKLFLYRNVKEIISNQLSLTNQTRLLTGCTPLGEVLIHQSMETGIVGGL